MARMSLWMLVTIVVLFAGAAAAVAGEEGPRGDPGLTPEPHNRNGECVWSSIVVIQPCDLQSTDESYVVVSPFYPIGEEYLPAGSMRVSSLSWGMEIWGWGYGENRFPNTATHQRSHSTQGSGSIRVQRSFAPENHVPWMEIDWCPRFRAEAACKNPAANATAAGVMSGSCQQLGVVVNAAGGAFADGDSHETGVGIQVFGVSLSLVAGSATSNTAAPISPYGQSGAEITAATAAFSCGNTMKIVAEWQVYSNSEAEAWLWDAFPHLDLHGECKTCAAQHYVVYGWVQ